MHGPEENPRRTQCARIFCFGSPHLQDRRRQSCRWGAQARGLMHGPEENPRRTQCARIFCFGSPHLQDRRRQSCRCQCNKKPGRGPVVMLLLNPLYLQDRRRQSCRPLHVELAHACQFILSFLLIQFLDQVSIKATTFKGQPQYVH